ncbi:hypothetical protein A9Q81_03975 [Gammaproteobacteria bacterium 42_54_T18]|nr:hypothetical protein A9Q81_03975 [Gammaproteobacteria bacterium 42_54_T18]
MFRFFEKKQFQLTVDDNPPVQLKHKETILNGAVRSDIEFPYSCKVGGCAACKCKLVSGKIKALTDASYLLSKEELSQNFILGCQSIPKSDVVIELPDDPLQQQECIGTIVEQKVLTHDISEVVVRLDIPMTYVPGQYANVSVIDKSYPARSYSFAHTCDVEGSSVITFFVRAVPNGKMSNWLLSSESLGKRINVKGSFGEFYLRESEGAMVCIAGGSGLAPIISILENALASTEFQQTNRDVLLLVGGRTKKDLYYTEQIESIRSSWDGKFTFLPVLSEEPAESSWDGLRGFVTDFLEGDEMTGSEGYFCGPPLMIEAAIEKMNALGVPKDKLFFDIFSDQSK